VLGRPVDRRAEEGDVAGRRAASICPVGIDLGLEGLVLSSANLDVMGSGLYGARDDPQGEVHVGLLGLSGAACEE
jgi:hypothetical protein